MYLSPWGQQQFFDKTGLLLVGGQLFCYEAGTVTKQSAFTDSTGDTALPNPIVLNAYASIAPSAVGTSCGLWLDPSLAYKFVLAPATDTDPPTNPITTIDNVVSAQSVILAALAQYEATLGGVQLGTIAPYGGTTAPSGWLLCYGQAVSRSTYSSLFAIIGTNFGIGDGVSTFNLPDLRGRVPLGKDDMGGSPANRVTQAVSGVSSTTLGGAGGDQNTAGDTFTSTSVSTTGLNDPGHKHVITTVTNGGGTPIGEITGVSGGPAPNGSTQTSFTGITATTTTTTTTTGTNAGTAQNVQPVQVTNFIIFAGV